MMSEIKPMLNTHEQIQHLKNKGVKFEIISEEKAEKYLNDNNNYFKLRAYRKNFPKHPSGENKDKYIDLDFAMLKDLSIIDMRLRYLLMHMALDIEHFAKVKLIKKIEQSDYDGYDIVSDYFKNLETNDLKNGTSYKAKLLVEIDRNKENPYCGGIINKYYNDYPVWAFVEIIPLGTFIDFYKFCSEALNDYSMYQEFYILKDIKQLRNACAHNTCLINDMSAKNSKHKLHRKIITVLGKNNISKTERSNKTKNETTRQIITLLYLHRNLINSSGVQEFEARELRELVERMFKHIDYYNGNEMIVSNFKFFKKIVDIFY